MAKDKEQKETTEAITATEVITANDVGTISVEPAPAPPAETFEEKQIRLQREDFRRRNAEAIAARRYVLLANGLPDDTAEINIADADKQCC
ncbi:MAG: hypothetical protein MOB07_23235 [Acidobacteria bacterium]|nr:hypothetical protein [Acidobacteriota bacterium]